MIDVIADRLPELGTVEVFLPPRTGEHQHRELQEQPEEGSALQRQIWHQKKAEPRIHGGTHSPSQRQQLDHSISGIVFSPCCL